MNILREIVSDIPTDNAKALFEFMRNIPEEYVPRIQDALTNAVRVAGDPYATSEQYSAVDEQLAGVQQRIGQDVFDALRNEIKERLEGRWSSAASSGVDLGLIGTSEYELSREVELGKPIKTPDGGYKAPPPTDVLELAEGIRRKTTPGYWPNWSVLGAIGGIVGVFAAGALFLGRGEDGRRVTNAIRDAQQSVETAQVLGRAYLSTSDVERLTKALRTPEAVRIHRPAALPPVVAAVAAQPAAVAIEFKNGTQHNFTAPFGDVYREMPPAAQEDLQATVAAPPEPPAAPAAPARRCTRSNAWNVDHREVSRISVGVAC